MTSSTWAVVVTFNRKQLLIDCLAAIDAQTLPPDKILIVDNASTDGTRELLADTGWLKRHDVYLLSLQQNSGGAGGFAAGISHAVTHGAGWLWLMDDDGIPSVDCLRSLKVECAHRSLDIICPLQVDHLDSSRPAFPIRDSTGALITYIPEDYLFSDDFSPNQANLFNGALFRKTAIDAIGLPRPELFIRGDEVEYGKRMLANGLRFGTMLSVPFYHPSDRHERIPIMFGLMTIRDAHAPFKNYYMFRNRALAFIEDGNWLLVPLDFLRYCHYFLISKHGDVKGLKEWCTATLDGLRRRLGRHPRY